MGRSYPIRRYDLVVLDSSELAIHRETINGSYKAAYARARALCLRWIDVCSEVHVVEYRPGWSQGVVIDAVRSELLFEEY